MAPVANLLGQPWYLEAESPAGDFVIWLDIERGKHVGGRVGVSPHAAEAGLMRWLIGLVAQGHDVLEDVRHEHDAVAEFDLRNCDEDKPYDGLQYRAAMAEICLLVDSVAEADKAYLAALPSSR